MNVASILVLTMMMQPPNKNVAAGHLTALCASLAVDQTNYYAANGRFFRCNPNDYSIDGCNSYFNPAQLSQAQGIEFQIDMCEGGANNGDGDRYSCSATFGSEKKRLAPTKRAGKDGKPPTSQHLASHDWRTKDARATPKATPVELRTR